MATREVIKVDIESGTYGNETGKTVTIQLPKLSRFIAETDLDLMKAARVFEETNDVNETVLIQQAMAAFIGFEWHAPEAGSRRRKYENETAAKTAAQAQAKKNREAKSLAYKELERTNPELLAAIKKQLGL